MKIRGIKFICDRCGKEEFCELDVNGEFKHGCSFHNCSLRDDTHLCDDCHKELNRIIKDYMKELAND